MSGGRFSLARRLAARVLAVSLLLPLLGVCCGGPGFATAAPVRMRFPEGPAHGFFTLSDAATGKKLAHGELVQWLEKRVVASRLLIRFDDGSLYDETVRFTQRPAFRITSYELTQKGAAFDEDQRVTFDQSGRYDVRQRKRGEDEKRADGTIDIPEDTSNGLTSVLAKNLEPGETAQAHLLTFRPEPLVLDLTITPEGHDPYWVGGTRSEATRFLVEPKVPGVKGVLATIVGKEPPVVRMWIAPEPAPVLVRFEGALFVDGPEWRMDLSAPRWKK